MFADAPLRVTDTTFRDAHQSSLATRVRTEDMEALARDMDRIGFWSMEVWGGATFDVATRFLRQDPWDRVRVLKKLLPRTPLQMLLRGQNLVGYRNYADDVVRAFVHVSAEVGIDVFRVFDAVNDERNFEASAKAIKECKKHFQAAICYSTTQGKLGGELYNIEYYTQKARIFQDMGADSICLKDMAGLLAPYDTYELIRALKAAVKVPVQLHTHYTSGMASMTCLKAAEAGVDVIDCALAPLALRSSQPAVEPLVVALEGMPRDTGLDLTLLFEMGQRLEAIADKYKDFLDTTRMSVIDTRVLMHQVPGGMLTNLLAQLREAGALERLEEVYAELPRTRQELGYPPLVTPTSQIVGSMAVNNVLFGRYKMVPEEVKNYVYGLYGKPPAPIDPDVQKIVLRDYPRGGEPITTRAADVLEPELEKAKEAIKNISTKMEDVLTYALYPTTGLQFLKQKYGLEKPTEEKPTVEVKPAAAPQPQGLRLFHVYIGDEHFEVKVGGSGMAVTGPTLLPFSPPATKAATVAPVVKVGEVAVVAPLPGMVIRYVVKQGDRVKEGDGVVIFEAMKMQNLLPAPKTGVVKSLTLAPGAKASKDDILAIIGD